jgi:hypothetical protein
VLQQGSALQFHGGIRKAIMVGAAVANKYMKALLMQFAWLMEKD